MKISSDMDLHQLEMHMGEFASREEAHVMRDLLVAQYGGRDMSQVSEDQWLDLLSEAVIRVHNPADDLLAALAEWDAWATKLNKGN